MKKKSKGLFIVAIFLSAVVQGQITKGNWLLGGNASYSSETLSSDLANDNQNYRTTQIQGNAGYFVVNRLAVGLRPDMLFSKAKLRPTDIKSKIFAIGPFLRYYFLPAEQMVNLFIDGDYSYGRSEVTGQNFISSSQYSIGAGPEIFLNSSVALEFTVRYSGINYDNDIDSKKKNLRISLGFQFHLEKEK